MITGTNVYITASKGHRVFAIYIGLLATVLQCLMHTYYDSTAKLHSKGKWEISRAQNVHTHWTTPPTSRKSLTSGLRPIYKNYIKSSSLAKQPAFEPQPSSEDSAWSHFRIFEFCQRYFLFVQQGCQPCIILNSERITLWLNSETGKQLFISQFYRLRFRTVW
jgi:hypothetical protein